MEWYDSIIVIFFGFLCVSIVAGLFFKHEDNDCDCDKNKGEE